jgi:hypothetical protein
MLIDVPHLMTESDQRRAALLADAENFRLARLARTARRARRRAARPPSGPPRPPEVTSDRSGTIRNDGGERRYAVSR